MLHQQRPHGRELTEDHLAPYLVVAALGMASVAAGFVGVRALVRSPDGAIAAHPDSTAISEANGSDSLVLRPPDLAVPPRPLDSEGKLRSPETPAASKESDAPPLFVIGVGSGGAETLASTPASRQERLADWLERAKELSGTSRDVATRVMLLHAFCGESGVDTPTDAAEVERDLRSRDPMRRARAAGAAPRVGESTVDALFALISDPTAGPLRGAAIFRLNEIAAARDRLLGWLRYWLDSDDPYVRTGAFAALPYVGPRGGELAIERANRGDLAEEWIDLLGQAVAWSGALARATPVIRSAPLLAATRRWVRPEYDLVEPAARANLEETTARLLEDRDASSVALLAILTSLDAPGLTEPKVAAAVERLARDHTDPAVRAAARRRCDALEGADARAKSVVRATYGIDGASVDVTDAVRRAVASGALRIRAGNALAGDPAFGQVKTLTIDFRVDGRSVRVAAREGEDARLP